MSFFGIEVISVENGYIVLEGCAVGGQVDPNWDKMSVVQYDKFRESGGDPKDQHQGVRRKWVAKTADELAAIVKMLALRTRPENPPEKNS